MEVQLLDSDVIQTILRPSTFGTSPKEYIEYLTELALSYTDSDIALLSVFNGREQKIEAGAGIEVRFLPDELSFTRSILERNSLVEVSDCTEDPRFYSDKLVVNHPKVRSYAGLPLKNQNGLLIGTICVLSKQKRSLSAAHIRFLNIITHNIIKFFENYKIIYEKESFYKFQDKLINELNQKKSDLDEFAYRTSHDLRAPIVRIEKLADYCIEDAAEGNTDEITNNCKKIISNCQKLSNLVTNIKDYTVADRKNTKIDEVDFDDLQAWVTAEIDTLYPFTEVKLGFKFDIQKTFYCLEDKLYKIVLNLIENGVKFADINKKESFVYTSFTLVQDNLVIHLKDNGVGINPSIKDRNDVYKIFTKFHPNINDGSGLGLSIVKKHIDSLGGTIEFKTSSKGTEFLINIPNQRVN